MGRLEIVGRSAKGNYNGKTCERGNKDRTGKTEEGRAGERQKASGEGSVALILVDRNFRCSDGGGGQRSQDGYKHTHSVSA